MCDIDDEITISAQSGESVRNQYLAALLMSLSTFMYGCAVGWVSPSLEYLQGEDSPLGEALETSDVAWVASLLCLGAILGTAPYGVVTDHMGRRVAGLMVAIPYAICWILKLSVKSKGGLFAARALAGIGGSGGLLVAPLYCSEIASPKCRGALGSIAVLAINAGILFAFVLGAFANYEAVLWTHLAIPVIFFATFFFMPETPTYLIRKEKYERASKAIAWLRSISEDDPATKNVMDCLKHEDLLASGTSGVTINIKKIDSKEPQNYTEGNTAGDEIPSWKFFVTSKVTLKAFAVCFILISIQGYIGIFAINNYAATIFKDAGSTLTPNNAAIVVSALQLLGSYGSTLLVERIGRKLLFISSAITVSIAMATLGTYFYFRNQGSDVQSVGWIPVVALSVAVAIYSLGAGPVPFIITSEVFMVQARGIATTIVIFWLWVTAFMVAQFYPPLVEAIGADGTFWAFAVIALSGTIFTFIFVPETKGKSLDEILTYFEDSNHNVHKYTTREAGELL